MSDTKNPRDGRLIASAALIGLIVVAGIIVVILRLAGGDDSGNTNGTNANPTASPSKAAGSSSSSRRLAGHTTTTLTDAPDATWKIVGTTAVPSDKLTGPGSFDAGVPRCFSRSPSGALFAASWLTALLNEPKYATPDLVRARVAPSPELEAMLAEEGGEVTKIPAQIAGFRVEDYSPDRATISIVTRLSDGPDAGALLQVVMTMVWRDGDWLWNMGVGGPQGNAVTSLAGFVPWSGV
jgi:hypothetical protein